MVTQTSDGRDRSCRRLSPLAASPPTLRYGRGRRLPPEILTDDEVRQLMAACGDEAKPVPLRNRALIALMYRAGLRVSEALDL